MHCVKATRIMPMQTESVKMTNMHREQKQLQPTSFHQVGVDMAMLDNAD